MAIDSDDHGDFIVVYDFTGKTNVCPVCKLEDELSEANKRIEELESQVTDLESEEQNGNTSD